MQERYDVIVIGAGPGGVSTALYARRLGLSVLLVDRHRFPRDKICGDVLGSKSTGYMRDLGLLDDVRAHPHERIDTVILGAPSGAVARFNLTPENTPQDPRLICRREVFDDILVRAAREKLDVLEGWTVTDVTRAPGGGARGIRCRDEAGDVRQFAGRVVVGADGYNSIVARKMGVYSNDQNRWLVATRQYFRGVNIPPHTVQAHYLDDTLPGYLWVFPLGDGTVNVGLGSVHATVKERGGLRRIHDRAVVSHRFKGLFAGAAPVTDVQGWHLPTPDRKRTICGDGFVLVGDAAGLVDPFTGEGIGNAMCSGEVAARVIAGALADNDAERVDLSEYGERVWKELDEGELALHYKLSGLARHRTLVNFVIGRAAKHASTVDWLTQMTCDTGASARKQSLLSPFTYLKLLLGRPR